MYPEKVIACYNTAMTAYSKTPLFKKLGIKEGMQILLINEPDDYEKLLPEIKSLRHSGLTKIKTINEENMQTDKKIDFIHLFSRTQEELNQLFPKLKELLKKNGMLWISWPKGLCGVGVTNLNDNIVRDIGLHNGLVDVKIASIDETWSGIKFVYRLKDRK